MVGMLLLAVLAAVFSKAFLASGQLAGRSARLLREDAEFCRDYYLDSELLEKEPAGTGETLFFVPEEDSEAVSDGGFSVRGIRLYRYTEDGKQGAVYDVGE